MRRKFNRQLDLKLILSILAAGLMSFTGTVVETAMNVTFPILMAEFSVSIDTIQWITTGYLLTLALVIPTSSFLKKRFPMKGLFVTAITLFIAGTLMGMLAPSFTILLVGRIFQGLGTGIALPLMFNIILEQAPLAKMGFIMGIASMIIALAPAVGPSLGGFIVSLFGWRMIFAVLLPLLFASLAMGVYAIRQSSPLYGAVLDVPGYILIAAAFLCFILASTEAGTQGWLSQTVMGLFGATFILLVLYVLYCHKQHRTLINIHIFHSAPYGFALISIILIQFICLGLGLILPNYAQFVLASTPLQSGCILLPGCLLGALVNPFGGRLYDHWGAGRPIMAGCICLLLVTGVYALFWPYLGLAGITGVYIFFALSQSLCIGNLMTTGLRSLSSQLTVDGNAVNTTMQQLAGAFGTAVASSMVATAQRSLSSNPVAGVAYGSQEVVYLMAVLAVCFTITSYLAIRTSGRSEG